LQEGGSCWRRRKLMKRTKDRFETFKITPAPLLTNTSAAAAAAVAHLSISLSLSIPFFRRFKTTKIKDLS
jgi:hypothetical protein